MLEYQSCCQMLEFVTIWNMSQVLRYRLATKIKQYRENYGYSREELSLMLGVDNSYISKLEKGRVNITIDKLEQITQIFNIDVVELF